MGDILKFPAPAPKFGYKRVGRCAKPAVDPAQLELFAPMPAAQILSFDSGLGSFERALICDERGDPQATEWYRQAIEEGSCVAAAYCNLGIIESKNGSTAKAFDCFTRSLKDDPRHAEAHYNLANLYFEVNEFRLAQVHYELAAEIEPDFANAFFNLALVSAVNNDPAAGRALARYQQLASEDEARHAEELLQNLRTSMAAAQGHLLG